MGNTKNKIIFLVDMDAFFVSVEEALNPELCGKPVIVGGAPDGRGVVSSASYTAREYGVRSGMPSARARQLCPKAIFLRGSHHLYASFSGRVMDILGKYTPAVEQVSVDEAYLDITDCTRLHRGNPLGLAERIHHDIRRETGLSASIGIGASRLIAKIAANLAKPGGALLVRPDHEAQFLAPLPVGSLPGVGPKSQKILHQMGIRVAGDLARFDPARLERVFGKYGRLMASKARGVDRREIMRGGESARPGAAITGAVKPGDARPGDAGKIRSISREITYETDTKDPERLKATLSYLAESVGRRVRKAGLVCNCVTVKLRYSDFTTHTRSITLGAVSDDTGVIFGVADRLLGQLYSEIRGKARLLGISVTSTQPSEQLELFENKPVNRTARLAYGMDAVRDRFGFESALLARSTLHTVGGAGCKA